MNYDTAWLLHNKILKAMSDRDDAYILRGKIQIDDAYLGGERPGSKAGRGSENKIPIIAAISLNESGHPIHAKITPVIGFSSEAVGSWAMAHLDPYCAMLTDGLACFRSVITAGCSHEAVVTGGKHPKDLPQLRWVNTHCWEISRPASAARSTPSTLTSTPSDTSEVTASVSTDASRYRR